MICLKPILETLLRQCPNCNSTLAAVDFIIPGMRNLADFRCPKCKKEYFGDLPSGQGLFTPILLDKKSGAVYDDFGVNWFSEWLADSFINQTDELVDFQVRRILDVKKKVVLLNCLDILYGHSLLKLLNAQYYIDRKPDFSLIIIVPPFLEWMLPDGIAEVWVVDLPTQRRTEWSNWLAGKIAERLESFQEVYLSVAFSHPQMEDFAIERFTRVTPFPLENFQIQKDNPIITFIWREDRLWETAATNSGLFGKFNGWRNHSQNQTDEQMRKIVRFAELLRGEFPHLDFAVAGIGQSDGFPDWILDLRLKTLNAQTERHWCERYSKSHLVVGVHGSNMLLPSAHAGGVIELISEDRQGNYLQDILFRNGNLREIMFRYRFVPHSTTPEVLARLASTILRYEDFRQLMSPEFCSHQENYDLEKWLAAQRSH